MKGDSGRSIGGLLPCLGEDGYLRRRRPAVLRAEVAKQPHHVMVVSGWRRTATEDPVQQIGIRAIEQSFEPAELGGVETGQGCVRERAEDEIALLGAAMP